MHEMTHGDASADHPAAERDGGDATLAHSEIARFAALADRWWDPAGPMAPLHAMNPARIGWISAGIAARFGAGARPDVLDVGCGAGLAAEALARAGHRVLGLDAAEELVAVARAHAAPSDLPLSYRVGRAEELAVEGARFAVVTALEVIEHVPDPGRFVALLSGLLAPGGLLFVSTLNRTSRAWLLAKFGAEYVARMLPVGTHRWSGFVTPGELALYGRAAGLRLADTVGLHPRARGWVAGGDCAVNYIARLEN